MANNQEDHAGRQHERKRANKLASLATDERPAITRLYSAWSDLKAEGWREIMYAPKDGTEIEIIECGSTGIHKAVWLSFEHKPFDSCGAFFADGNWPSSPVLFRNIKKS